MLVLTRFPNEKLLIVAGEIRIEVMVVQVRGDKVRLGVTAPSWVQVDREEVFLDKQRESARCEPTEPG